MRSRALPWLVLLVLASAVPLVVPPDPQPALAQAKKRDPNAFNRLLKRPTKPNAPPWEDGIHDPDNPGTRLLQPPAEAFEPLPKAQSGNRVDWVKALEEGYIHPRVDLHDPEAEMNVMDLDIVMEVKGTMPDVVYPHRQHTEWLDCVNCHTDIFIPQRGKNQISMAAILLGEKCGVCHGKVAFPVSDCRRCHSRPKGKDGQRTAEAQAEVQPAAAEVAVDRGAELYAENCAACHGDEGEGMGEDFPPLVGSGIVSGPLAKHLEVVVAGVPDTAMAAWGEILSDEELAAIVAFERRRFGAQEDAQVSPDQVRRVREAAGL